MSQLPRPGSGGLGRKLVLGLVVVVAGLLAVAVWANALAEPVVRAGVPTGSVTPPAPKPKPSKPVTPKPSASTSAKPTGSAKPSESAKPSAKPTTSAKPKPTDGFTTSTATKAPVSQMGTLHRFIVKVQTSTGLDANEVADQVAGVLNDPRSWTGSGNVRFALVKDAKKADFTIYVSDPKAADSGCDSRAWVCRKGSRLVLSAAGWGSPSKTYAGDQTGFRRYLVNHAVGGFLGEDKASCKKAGSPAPVMAPQADDLNGCTANPWPFG